MLARVNRLTPAAREVVEQLAVVPTQVEQTLLRTLCPDLAPVAEAERLGVLEVRPGAVAFRHELARRAAVESLPVTVRLERNARVAAALLAGPTPDLARVLHHTVEAGDDAAVVRHGPTVAREASRAGAHRQAVAAYEQVLARSFLLDPVEHAALLDAHAWSLYNINRLHDAAAAAGAAVALAERQRDPALVRYLVTLSRQHWLLRARRRRWPAPPRGRPRPRQGPARGRPGQPRRGPGARRPRGGGLAPRPRRHRSGARVLARNYRGSALLQLGDLEGRTALLDSVAEARELGQHEYAMRGYYNLAEGLGGSATTRRLRGTSTRRTSTAATATSRPTATSSRLAGNGCG